MSREPSYPKDVPVGSVPPGASPSTEEGSNAGSSSRKKYIAGAAIGIGSAAIVAALLYANRGRRS
jgi:hypothetical protein